MRSLGLGGGFVEEQRVVGVCEVSSAFLRMFRKNENKRYVLLSLR